MSMKLQRITDMRGNNISLRTKNTPNSKLIYDTLRPAETYVDQGKDADANTHSEGSQAKPSQAKVLTGRRRLTRSASRRPPVC